MNSKRISLFTKLGLAVCFLLGLLFVFLGIRGGQTSSDAGFGSGESSSAISDLSKDVSSAWNDSLSSDRSALADGEQTAVDDALLPLVKESWESRKAGGGEEAGAFIDEAGAGRAERLYKLMYLSGLMNGPKVTSSVKKAIAAISGNDRPAFRQQLLRCIPDENQAVADHPGSQRLG